MPSSKKEKIFLIALIAVAFIIRLAAVLKYGDFWDDEMFNVIYGQKPWPQGLIYWLWETNPPLHMLILRIWFLIFPVTEFFARLPSLIAGLGTVYLLYILAKEMFGRGVAAVSAFYLALHPYHIFWSATARIYSFSMLFTVWSALYFYRLFFSEKSSAAHRRGFAAINTLLVFSHLSSAFFLAGQLAVLMIVKNKKAIADWIKFNILPFLAGAAWIGASLYIKAGNSLGSAWFFHIQHTFKSAATPVLNLIVGQFWFWPGLALIAVFLISIGFALRQDLIQKKINLAILMVVILTPISLAAALHIWHIKFFVSILPLLIIAVSYALLTVFKKPFVPAIFIALVCALGLFNLWQTLPLTDWQAVQKYITAHQKQNAVLIYNNYILKSQMDRYLAGLDLPKIPLLLYKNLSWDDMAVKKNYLFTMISEDEKEKWYQQNNLDGYAQIFLLQGEYEYMNKLTEILAKHGWVAQNNPVAAPISGEYQIYVFEKNSGTGK